MREANDRGYKCLVVVVEAPSSPTSTACSCERRAQRQGEPMQVSKVGMTTIMRDRLTRSRAALRGMTQIVEHCGYGQPYSQCPESSRRGGEASPPLERGRHAPGLAAGSIDAPSPGAQAIPRASATRERLGAGADELPVLMLHDAIEAGRKPPLGLGPRDVTEMPESIPRSWKVIQTVRDKFTCRQCEAITQPPTALCEGDAARPVTTDVVALLGRPSGLAGSPVRSRP